jgi:peptidoglycan hydrolase CwlO-like protein
MVKDIKKLFGNREGLDDKSVEFLCNAMAANSLQGFDYIKFKKSLRALLKMKMEEKMAYKSAFATASTLGLTKDKLIKTAEHYGKVLNREQEQFEEALRNQMKQRVSSKHDETHYLREKISEYKEKIEALKKQIDDTQRKIDTADAEMREAKTKIEDTKEKFLETYAYFKEQIKTDIELMNTHL